MKAFDIEKLQSLTLSGEKMNKEIFEALFINPSPYYGSSQNTSGYFSPYNYTTGFNSSYENCDSSGYYQQSKTSIDATINVRNYEIFKGAFETAVNSGKTLTTELTTSEYPYYDNRYYQGQNFY